MRVTVYKQTTCTDFARMVKEPLRYMPLTLHLWILGMVRWVVSSSVELAVCLLVVLVPLFFYSCLVPFLLIFLLLMGGAACMIVRNRLVKIWN